MNQTQYDLELFSDFFGSQPQACIWLEPIWDASSNTIIDFVYRYSNELGLAYLNLAKGDLEKISISKTPSLNDEMRSKIMQEMITVFETGVSAKTDIYNPVIEKYAKVLRVKFRGGILTVIQDTTEENRTLKQLSEKTKELESQKAFTDNILSASLNGVIVAMAVRDQSGHITDFVIKRINPAFSQYFDLPESDCINRSFLAVYPAALQLGIFDFYCQVCDTGISNIMELEYQHIKGMRHYQISCVKLDDGILVNIIDITIQKNALKEMEQHRYLLDSILKNSSNGISVGEMVRDEKGTIIDFRTIVANDAAVKFTGINKDVYLTKKASEVDPNFIGSPYYQMCIQCMETGEPFLTQYYLEHIGRWLEVTVSKMDAEHQIYIFTDITSVKEAQLELERSAERFRTVIETSQAGVFMGKPIRDEKGEIVDFEFTMVNQVLASFVNKNAKELIGEPASNWFVKYKSNGLFDRFKATYETGVKDQFDFHYLGEYVEVWVNIMTTKLGDEVMGTFTDFTPIKTLHLQLEKSVEDLKRSNTSLEEFAYAASHDLQEPLRKIYTFSDRLKRELSEKLNTHQHNMFHRMESATIRMKTLIEDLLAYSQVSASSEVFQLVDLNEIVNQVLQDLEATITETGAKITYSSLCSIPGNERQLRQLFQNLIGNALKYRKPGVTPEVTILSRQMRIDNKDNIIKSLLPTETYCYVEIRDNGIGFEQEHAEKIFQVFQRLHGRSEYEGTGVGLAIVKKVISNHNGHITAESAPGMGAKFSIYLPL